jgi:hypothetical protein
MASPIIPILISSLESASEWFKEKDEIGLLMILSNSLCSNAMSR